MSCRAIFHRKALLLLCVSFMSIYSYYHTQKIPRATQLSMSPQSGLVGTNFLRGFLQTNTSGFQTRHYPSEKDVRDSLQNFIEGDVKEDDPTLVELVQSFIVAPSGHEQNFVGTYYQTPQTKAVMDILKDKHGGFFIECGGFDGETSSNTAYLEYHLGWTGLLIEMSPLSYLELLGKNRNAYSINACLSTSRSPAVETFTQFGQQTRVYRGQGPKEQYQPPGSYKQLPKHVFSVPCFPLLSMLKAIDVKKIDYFSLDIEGLEMEALNAMPWSQLDISVLSVEYRHGKHPPEAMKRLLEHRGYSLYANVTAAEPEKRSWAADFIFVKTSLMLSLNLHHK